MNHTDNTPKQPPLEVSEIRRRAAIKHGFYGTPIYNIWTGLFQRCYNPTNKYYARYGGRGIKVCERWHRIENFVADIGERPNGNYSLDRIDNDGDYCPENCRWATCLEQSNNTRRIRWITFKGKTQSLMNWSRELNVSHTTLARRIDTLGWSVERALSTPTKPHAQGRQITFDGESHTLAEWAKELQMDYFLLHNRLRNGWSVERTFTTPLQRQFSWSKKSRT